MTHRFGLLGIDGDGTVYSPNGTRLARVPFSIASFVQRMWNAVAIS